MKLLLFLSVFMLGGCSQCSQVPLEVTEKTPPQINQYKADQYERIDMGDAICFRRNYFDGYASHVNDFSCIPKEKAK